MHVTYFPMFQERMTIYLFFYVHTCMCRDVCRVTCVCMIRAVCEDVGTILCVVYSFSGIFQLLLVCLSDRVFHWPGTCQLGEASWPGTPKDLLSVSPALRL